MTCIGADQVVADLPEGRADLAQEPHGLDVGNVVFFAGADPLDENEPSVPVCLECLREDGDEQLERGLRQARLHGQVDYNPVTDDWFVPLDDPDRITNEGGL